MGEFCGLGVKVGETRQLCLICVWELRVIRIICNGVVIDEVWTRFGYGCWLWVFVCD